VGAGQQLQLLDLRDPAFQGTNITTFLTRAPAGDGLVNVGRVNAIGRDLGNVSINGDLGAIDCGDIDTTTPGLRSLSVRSIGRFGLSTQGPGGDDLVSFVDGALGRLIVKGDIANARIRVQGVGKALGSVVVGGSLVGHDSASAAEIFADGGMGPVQIGG